MPVSYQDGKILVAFIDPLDLEAREAANQIFSKLIKPAIGPRQPIQETIELHRRGAQRGATAEPDDSTIIGIVNGLLDDAMGEQASDIHIEPMKDRLRIRFCCDDVMITHKEFNLALAAPVTTRIKVMAEANIAERRRHHEVTQDNQNITLALVKLANKGCCKIGLGWKQDRTLVLPTTAEAQFLRIDEIALAEYEIMLEDRFFDADYPIGPCRDTEMDYNVSS